MGYSVAIRPNLLERIKYFRKLKPIETLYFISDSQYWQWLKLVLMPDDDQACVCVWFGEV